MGNPQNSLTTPVKLDYQSTLRIKGQFQYYYPRREECESTSASEWELEVGTREEESRRRAVLRVGADESERGRMVRQR